MNSEWENERHALEADQYRKKIRKEQVRKRQRQLQILKKLVIAAILLAILTGTVIITLGRTKVTQSAESYSDTEQNQEVVADVEDEESNSLIVYPTKSESYVEIEDENVNSPYVAVLDVENSQVIAGKNSDAKIYPASMTKVMTLIVAVEQLEGKATTFTMTSDIISPLIAQQASRAGFEPGEEITVDDLLYGMVLPSGADAAVALAVMTAGSESAFADLMNEKCQELGLQNTHFVNVSGLYDEEQYTTPIEMAMIMQYAMSIPECAQVLSTYQYTTSSTTQHPNGIQLTSTMFSRMYGNEVEGVTILAGKTGYTEEAGNCLVSYAEKDGHHYVAVTAGASYKWYSIFDDFELYKTYLPSTNTTETQSSD